MAIIGKDHLTFVLSPSDLTNASACEYGWLRSIDIKRNLVAAPEGLSQDPMLSRAGKLGDAHEQRHLDRLSLATEVVKIDSPHPYNETTLTSSQELTLDALRRGVPVVAQAALFDGGFGGLADFLIRNAAGEYEVWDAKLPATPR